MNNIDQNEPEEEEIPNIEQFQVGRSHPDEQDDDEVNADEIDDDAGYTEGEKEFADGEGTQLNEEIDNLEDEDDEDLD